MTRAGCRKVLFAAHNMTSATRLPDVLPLFDGDLRVQLLATRTGSSPFPAGVTELPARAGLPVNGWRNRAPHRQKRVFGLSPEWLLADGRPLASATVLSHPEQFDRLRAA